MSRSRFSLRKLLLVTALVACVVGLLTHRVQESRRGRFATYAIWDIDGNTVGIRSDYFTSLHRRFPSTPQTYGHGFWNDLLGYDHTRGILFSENEFNAPIDENWIRQFDSAIRRLPYLKVVFIQRDDFTDEMIREFADKHQGILFKRQAKN